MAHFLSILDTPEDRLRAMLAEGFALRARRRRGEANQPALSGRTLAMIFEKPSLRTRVSFEQAMNELGGHAIALGQEVGLGKRESAADVTRVLGGMVQGIAARVFDHATLTQMARHSPVPVVNMLSDRAHPAQALADLMTIADEFCVPPPGAHAAGPTNQPGDLPPTPDLGTLAGRTVAFVGDGNNVARSLASLCAVFRMRFILASPKGYQTEGAFARELARRAGGADFAVTHDPRQAVAQADVVYADTFVSMGQEDQEQERLAAFEGFQVNDRLLASAQRDPIVLHCLPAHRGTEITDAVMDGPRSRVFPQAHNRLHAQKGLLKVLLAHETGPGT